LLNRLHWQDSRLEIIDLHKDDNLNILSGAFKDDIWTPRLIFFNTEERASTLADEKTFAAIVKNGSFEIASLSKLFNEHIFTGSENPIIMTRSYINNFLCTFDMSLYPFDNQRCPVILTMDGNSGKFVDLVIDKLIYSGAVDLNQYYVKDTYIDHYTIPPSL
jgi:hypothetical protein